MKKKAAKRAKPEKAKKKSAARKIPARSPAGPKAEEVAATHGGLRSLPPRQRMFVAEYLANGQNGAKAARTVGYSAKTAESQASRLLRNVKVAAAIAERTEKVLAKREITAERVLDEIAKLAFFDPRKLFDAAGELIPVCDLDDETAASIAGVDVSEMHSGNFVIGHLKKIKIADKGANLERLGRYFKMFTDKVQHSFDLSDLSDEELEERIAKHGVKKK